MHGHPPPTPTGQGQGLPVPDPPPPSMEKVPGQESGREEARTESEAESRLCSDVWRSVSQLRFLAPQRWFLANCAQFMSNPKQMGPRPAPTRLPHSPPDPGAPESREGPPPSNQAARPPAGRAGHGPFWGAAPSSGREVQAQPRPGACPCHRVWSVRQPHRCHCSPHTERR